MNNTRTTRSVQFIVPLILGILLLAGITGCAALVEEARAFGIADSFVDNYDASRMAIQAIEADVLPEDDEYFAGRAAAARILDSYDIYDDEAANRYINVLGQTLALASTRPVIYAGYRFLILDTDEINGLATPGGHIFVTRGLLRLAENEHEVAAILAHEISHIENRHGAKAIMETKGRNLALRAEALNYRLAAVGAESGILGRGVAVLEERVQSVVNALLGDGYSVDAEKEADLGAIQILMTLGYDPRALSTVLDRLKNSEKLAGRVKAGFHKTHPKPERRVREIERRLENYPGITQVDDAVANRRYQAALGGI
ncbi:MAG: M48 family metalloprotease [Spirochaetia bacterium]